MNDNEANVIPFNGITKADISVEKVMDGAKHLAKVIVIGLTEDGEEWFASSFGDNAEMNWLADRFKRYLLNVE